MERDHLNPAAGVTENDMQAMQRVYDQWDDAVGNKDADAAAELYAPDSVLESPLVRHLAKAPEGLIQGREKIRRFFRMVFERLPPIRRRHRTGYFTDGRIILWEYPRATPDGDQLDLVEIMEVEHALIQRHRVYWGWLSLKLLEQNRIWGK